MTKILPLHYMWLSYGEFLPLALCPSSGMWDSALVPPGDSAILLRLGLPAADWPAGAVAAGCHTWEQQFYNNCIPTYHSFTTT